MKEQPKTFKRVDRHGHESKVPRSMVENIARLYHEKPDEVMAKADQGLVVIESPIAKYELVKTGK